MKKVLLITLEYPPQIGGIGVYTHQIASGFPKNIAVLAPLHHDAAVWDSAVPYSVYRKKFLFPTWIWPRWLRLFFVVWKLANKEQVTSLFIHHALPVGYVGFLLKRLKKIPYVLFFHGADMTSAKSQTPWKKRMIRFVASNADLCVVNSQAMKKRLEDIIGSEKFIEILFPCPESAFFTPSSKEETETVRNRYALDGKTVMLSVSRIAEGKGYPHLARLMPRLLVRFPHLVWVIVGDGPKRAEVEKLIDQLSLQNVVRFVGALPREDLRTLYGIADIFVLLTHPDDVRGEEGFGIAFLEAAHAGVPVVAGRTGGVEEAVIHGRTGLVVNPYQLPEVEEAIVNILSNHDVATSLRNAAKDRVQTEFQWKKQIEKLRSWVEGV